MEQESKIEFQRRWVATAESDFRSAKRKFLNWFCLFIAMAAAFHFIEEFLPRSGWGILTGLLLDIAFVISSVKMALSASNTGDAKKFLRECRAGLANEVQGTR